MSYRRYGEDHGDPPAEQTETLETGGSGGESKIIRFSGTVLNIMYVFNC